MSKTWHESCIGFLLNCGNHATKTEGEAFMLKEKNEDIRDILRDIATSQRQGEENHRKLEETMRKLGEDLNKASGNFNRKWGDFLENLIEGDLVSLLRNWGFDQDIDENIQPIPNVIAPNDDGTDKYELDLIVKNGDLAFVVEVKTTLEVSDVNYFLEKLEELKDDFPAYKNKTVYGCVAYINIEKEKSKGKKPKKKKDALAYAHEKGLLTIRAPGGPANIATITSPKGLKLKEF